MRAKSTKYITAAYVVFLYQQNKVSNIITFGNIQKFYMLGDFYLKYFVLSRSASTQLLQASGYSQIQE